MAPIQYIVEGGQRLSGSIEPSGNKNAALPIIAAALLTEHPVTLENVPRIRDTETLVELIRSVGAAAEWTARNTLHIHAKSIRAADLDPDLCVRIRASILLAGPLLARCGEVMLPPPGGDVIGRRRLDTHVLALEQLGAKVTATDRLEFRAARLAGADVFLDEPSVTATENALVAAVAADGVTYLRNAASEPHVQDLANFLVALGAKIEGIGTNTMIVHGPATLGGATYRIQPDHIEVGSLIGLAAVTRSPLRIVRAGVEHLRSIRMGFERLGIVCRIEGDDLIVPSNQTLKIQGRFWRPRAEAGGPALAGFPGRSDVDRDRHRHAMRGRDPDVREDVRIADVLRRQADRDGRAHRIVRPAPRHHRRTQPAARRDDDLTRHPRRHGHAAGGGLRRGHLHDRQRRPDRARLRAHRRTAECARREDQARAGAEGLRRLPLLD
ncbi:UDP-N-acetylglucosamine 1-carboxyvinyltransferase [Bradyrhizobium sp. LM6.10]